MTCMHCGLEIEDRAHPSMDGLQEPHWVHVGWGGSYCFPRKWANSPKAEPTTE